MKKRDAVETSVDEMVVQQNLKEINREKDELKIKKDRAHPFLIKRMGSGLFDFLLTAIVTVGAFVFSYFIIFPKIGYQKAANYVVNAYKESNLYVMGMTGYEQLSYDESKTPEENYDVPITHYYTTNERAINEHKYEIYQQAKLDSSFYEINESGEYVRKSTVSSESAKSFLQLEYNKAVTFFESDKELIAANYLTNMSMSVTLLITTTLGSTIFFLLVPLFEKRNRTFGYMISKLIPVDSKTLAPVDRKKNLLRNFIFISITFISPFTMNLWFGTLAYSFIPFFINIGILCFTRYNTGLHDMAANVTVINESYSNSFEILEAINSQGGQQ